MNEIAGSILENKIHGQNHETGKPVSSGESFIYFSVILIALSAYNSSARKAMLNLDEDQGFSHNFGRLIDLEGLEKLLLNSNNPDSEIILIFLYYLLHYYKQPGYSNYIKMRDMAFKNHSRFNSRMLFLICSMLSSMLYDIRKNIEPEKFGMEYHNIAEFSLKNKCPVVSPPNGALRSRMTVPITTRPAFVRYGRPPHSLMSSCVALLVRTSWIISLPGYLSK